MSKTVQHYLSRLLVAVLAIAVCSAQPPQIICRDNVDVLFLVDASTSIGEQQFRTQLDWAATVAEEFLLADAESGQQGSRFGALVYSTNTSELFKLSTWDKHAAIRQALTSAPYLGESSRTSTALTQVFVDELFSEDNGGRPDAKDILVLITDGRSSYGVQALIAAKMLMSSGVTILTVGLEPNTDKVALMRLAHTFDDAFYIRGETATKQDLISMAAGVGEKICLLARQN